MALQVHAHDAVPLLLAHVDDDAVAEDAGVVHEHVEVAERVDGLLDEPASAVPVGDVLPVDDRLAAHGADVVDRLLGGRGVGAATLLVAAEVVDDDLGALAREEERVLPTEPPAGAGDDGDPTVQCTHHDPPRSGRRKIRPTGQKNSVTFVPLLTLVFAAGDWGRTSRPGR